jgi:hypothetical protein
LTRIDASASDPSPGATNAARSEDMDAKTKELVELAPGGIWVGERALWFGGVRLRSRMTVVRLADGKLWVHSASEPTPSLCAALDRLGEVRWVVVPNRYHHLHAAAMKARDPAAQVIGPASVTARNPGVVPDISTAEARLPSLVPELTPVALRGVSFLDETLFFHRETRTLIGADLMMCGCAADHWTWRWASRIFGQYERFQAPPDVRWNTRANPLVRESLAQLAKLPLERILVAHSDPIVDRPAQHLEEAWRFVRA